MAMLIYTTGNGYSCNCCRRTDQNYTHFNDDEIDNLIKECVEISQYAEGDFYINTIEGYSGDSDELERLITKAISADEKARAHAAEINEIQKNITSIDRWFDGLEAEKAAKIKRREELQAKLTALEAS